MLSYLRAARIQKLVNNMQDLSCAEFAFESNVQCITIVSLSPYIGTNKMFPVSCTRTRLERKNRKVTCFTFYTWKQKVSPLKWRDALTRLLPLHTMLTNTKTLVLCVAKRFSRKLSRRATLFRYSWSSVARSRHEAKRNPYYSLLEIVHDLQIKLVLKYCSWFRNKTCIEIFRFHYRNPNPTWLLRRVG